MCGRLQGQADQEFKLWLISQVQKHTSNVSQKVPVSPSMSVSKSARQRMQHADKYKLFDQSLQTAWTVHQ